MDPRREDSLAPWRLSASEGSTATRKGKLTIEEWAKSCLSRIHERDPTVRAWVHVDPHIGPGLLEQARQLDAIPQEARGPLHGIPIGVKDIILTKDFPTQYNSRLYESDKPIEMDAPIVTVLRQAGALIFGKTTTTEYAATYQGGVHQNQTTNPHDSSRTPGGSSSGSAAAVGDYHVPIALGTQTVGSMIRPGSFTGIYAFKPTWGAISREGVGQYSITCDTLGFFARDPKDFDLLAPTFQLADDEVRPFKLEGTRIAFIKTHLWHKAGPALQSTWERAKHILADEGASVEEATLPADFEKVPDWHQVILASEGKSSFLAPYMSDRTLLHKSMIDQVENAKGVSRKQQLEAYDNCARLRPVWDEFAREFDAIFVPGVQNVAPQGLDHTGDPSLCSIWTVLHAPMMNVPGFAGENGLPLGLSIVAARFADQHVINVAKTVGPIFLEKGGWSPKNL